MKSDDRGRHHHIVNALSQPPWASKALGDDPARMLESIHRGLTVDSIATERAKFETCAADEALAVVIERNRSNAFDFLPVTEPEPGTPATSARIIGLLEIVPYVHGKEPQGDVRETMRPLSEENLIGADASIITFLRNADHQRCRLVISGPEISGLVTLSDLQQLPVRAALFAMVTQLEMIMASWIRAEFGNSDGWMERLSKERQLKVHEKAATAKSDDGFVELLLFTQFGDKVAIIKKSPVFGWTKGSFKSELDQVQNLRDDLAHANDYAATRAAEIRTCETVRLIEMWIDRLSAWPQSPSGAKRNRI
jgi:hypothetical protein